MNTAELKSLLHQLVVETNDNSVLEKVRSYFITLRQSGKDIDWWDELTDQEKDAIEKGQKQIKNGDHLSHEQVRKDVSKLFRKG
ncbi:MAG: hypothetical protein KDD36_02065 [Flavobacteriales bacterium]|nr:hypothetical protein [Flavobacteriales bacterium]